MSNVADGKPSTLPARCPKRCPNAPIPPSMTVESAAVHPGFKYLLVPGAQCELDAGHGEGTDEFDIARQHRNGLLLWWDPVIIRVAGRAS